MTVLKKFGMPVIVLSTLAACGQDMTASTESQSTGGLSFSAYHSLEPDLSAVEFSIIDENNDGLVDADEMGDYDISIGND